MSRSAYAAGAFAADAGRSVIQCRVCGRARRWVDWEDAVSASWRCDWASAARPRPWTCGDCVPPPVLAEAPAEPRGALVLDVATLTRLAQVDRPFFEACARATLATIRPSEKKRVRAGWAAFARAHGLLSFLPRANPGGEARGGRGGRAPARRGGGGERWSGAAAEARNPMTTEKKRAPKPVHHVRIRLNFVIGFKEPVAALPEGVRRLEDFIVGGLKAAGIEADELIRGAEVSATMVSDPRKRGGR